MKPQRAFIVTVNGKEVARYKGQPGGAYQVATNHAADIYWKRHGGLTLWGTQD